MKSGGFSSKVGLILAAAGSAVGISHSVPSLRPLVWLAAYYDGIPRW